LAVTDLRKGHDRGPSAFRGPAQPLLLTT